MNTNNIQKNEQAVEAKQYSVLIGPGTAGVVQRIPSKGEPDPKQLKMLEPVKAGSCSQNEY